MAKLYIATLNVAPFLSFFLYLFLQIFHFRFLADKVSIVIFHILYFQSSSTHSHTRTHTHSLSIAFVPIVLVVITKSACVRRLSMILYGTHDKWYAVYLIYAQSTQFASMDKLYYTLLYFHTLSLSLVPLCTFPFSLYVCHCFSIFVRFIAVN